MTDRFESIETIIDETRTIFNLQHIGIKKMKFMFFVEMQVEVRDVLMATFVGKIEVESKFFFASGH